MPVEEVKAWYEIYLYIIFQPNVMEVIKSNH